MYEVERFIDHLGLERGLSPRTLEAYERDVRRLVDFLEGRGLERPGQAGAGDLREFAYSLKDRGLAASSIRRSLSAIRTYYGFLLMEGIVVADPTERVELPRMWRRLPDALTCLPPGGGMKTLRIVVSLVCRAAPYRAH